MNSPSQPVTPLMTVTVRGTWTKPPVSPPVWQNYHLVHLHVYSMLSTQLIMYLSFSFCFFSCFDLLLSSPFLLLFSSLSSSSSLPPPPEINLKQQLVDQLEKAQRNLYTMKQQYEEKMQLLQHQIRSVESERDKVLKEISKC